MRNTLGVVVTLLGLVVALGCSSSSDDKSDAGAGTAGTGSTAGTGTAGTSTAGTGTAGTSTAGTSGPVLTCEDAGTPPTSCGGTTCPEVPAFLADACQVVCCTAADECGTRNASAEAQGSMLANCTASTEVDPTCESREIMFMGSTQTLQGCRLQGGRRGLSALGASCPDPCDIPGEVCGEDAGI